MQLPPTPSSDGYSIALARPSQTSRPERLSSASLVANSALVTDFGIGAVSVAFQRGDGFVQLDDPPRILGVKALHEAPVKDGAALPFGGGVFVCLKNRTREDTR